MRKVLIDSIVVAGLATAGLFIARALAPGRHELELDIYALTLGGLAVLCAVTWLRRALPPAGESSLQRALERARPVRSQLPELARLEREVYIGAAQAFDLHYRVRPVLREIALARLAERGLRLDSGDEAVREAARRRGLGARPPRSRAARGPSRRGRSDLPASKGSSPDWKASSR